MQRCLNDMFGGTCIGEPEIESSETIGSKETGPIVVKKCKLNTKTCGSYKSFSETVKPALGLGKARIVKSTKTTSVTRPKAKTGKGFTQEALL